MYKFNLNTLVRVANGSSKVILDYFRDRRDSKPLKRKSARICLGKPKNSFILNIFDLLLDRTSTEDEKIVYIYLCALRDLSKYKLHKYTRLPIQYVVFDLEKLSYNKLLTITNDEIIFKYEEESE